MITIHPQLISLRYLGSYVYLGCIKSAAQYWYCFSQFLEDERLMIYTPYSCQISIRFENDAQQHIICVGNTKWHKSLSEWIKGEIESQNDVLKTLKRNSRKKNCWLVSFSCEPFCLPRKHFLSDRIS